MVKLVTKEIKDYLKNELRNNFSKLSFIGFSMGGIIARSVLKYLQEYKNRFYLLLTFSSPHLGLSFCDGSLFNIGVWFMQVFNKKKSSINQLSLEDEKKKEDLFLYKLSKEKFIQDFEYVLFLGSYEDKYSHFESSLVVKGDVIRSKKDKKIDIVLEMMKNLQENLESTNFIRIFIYFKNLKMDFDHFIGKKAHIEFLINHYLLKNIVSRNDFLFK